VDGGGFSNLEFRPSSGMSPIHGYFRNECVPWKAERSIGEGEFPEIGRFGLGTVITDCWNEISRAARRLGST